MEGLLEIIAQSKQKSNSEILLIQLHHTLMKEYGWIPLDDFKKIPIVTLLNLVCLIDRDNKRMENRSNNIKKK